MFYLYLLTCIVKKNHVHFQYTKMQVYRTFSMEIYAGDGQIWIATKKILHLPSNDFCLLPDDSDVHSKLQCPSFLEIKSGQSYVSEVTYCCKKGKLHFSSYGTDIHLL